MSGARGTLATLAALAAASLAGCGGTGSGGAPPTRPTPPAARDARTAPAPARRARGDHPPRPAELIGALLARRARALAAGDVGAYARTATPAWRPDDRAAARTAARTGVRRVTLGVRRVRVSGTHARVQASISWRIRGVRGTFTGEQALRAVRTARGWRIAASADRRGLVPWEVAAFERRDEPHFVVLSPAGLDIDALGLPAQLADGYARIATALPRAPLRRRYLVVVAATAEQAHRLTEDIQGVEGLAAISDTGVSEAGPARRVQYVVSQRLLVVWPPFAALAALQRGRVVTHELTHLVLARSTSGRTPSWLVEGIALYVSGDRRDEQARAILRGAAGVQGEAARPALSLRRLSTPTAIARSSGAEQAGAYAYTSAAAFALADAHGREALLRLYDAFNDERLRGPPGAALTSRVLQRTIGQSLDAFEAALRAGLS